MTGGLKNVRHTFIKSLPAKPLVISTSVFCFTEGNMTNQHGTSVISTLLTYGELADLIITEYREGQHSHYFLTDGNRRQPVELPQAQQLRRDGVVGKFDATRPLRLEDGE